MCDHHAGRVARVLGELPRYYDELAEIMLPSRQVVSDDVRVATSKTKPLPINGDARAAQEDMLRLLRDIEIIYSDAARRGFEPYPITERAQVVHFARFARRHLVGILVVDVKFGLDLLALNHRCRFLLGLNTATQRLAVPCPSCDNTQLVRENGAGYATCKACGKGVNEQTYNELAARCGLRPMFAGDDE